MIFWRSSILAGSGGLLGLDKPSSRALLNPRIASPSPLHAWAVIDLQTCVIPMAPCMASPLSLRAFYFL